MSINKTDLAYKKLIGRRVTDENKNYFEEYGDSTINVHLDETWADPIPENPADAVAAGVAEYRELFTLTEDVTVPNQQCWYAEENSARLRDWIPDKYGLGYRVRLFDANGSEIFLTDQTAEWYFDCPTGVLTFSGSATAFPRPFKVTGWRYVGRRGTDVATGEVFDPGLTLTAGSALSAHICVVAQSDGTVVAADSADVNVAERVVGVTSTSASAAGQTVRVVPPGHTLAEPSWSWDTAKPVFLGPGGSLTQVAPSSGVSVVVAVPLSPTSILVRVGPSVILA